MYHVIKVNREHPNVPNLFPTSGLTSTIGGLHPFFKDLCVEASNIHKVKISDETIVEIEHKIHDVTSVKYDHDLVIHRDSDSFGDCFSILYYYRIDQDIYDNHLDFYEESTERFCFQRKKYKCVARYTPQQGDVITFFEKLHRPGEYWTNSNSVKIRAFVALFIKYKNNNNI